MNETPATPALRVEPDGGAPSEAKPGEVVASVDIRDPKERALARKRDFASGRIPHVPEGESPTHRERGLKKALRKILGKAEHLQEELRAERKAKKRAARDNTPEGRERRKAEEESERRGQTIYDARVEKVAREVAKDRIAEEWLAKNRKSITQAAIDAKWLEVFPPSGPFG